MEASEPLSSFGRYTNRCMITDSGIDLGKTESAKSLPPVLNAASSQQQVMPNTTAVKRDAADHSRIAARIQGKLKHNLGVEPFELKLCKRKPSLRDLVHELESSKLFDRIKSPYDIDKAEATRQKQGNAKEEATARPVASASDDDMSDLTTATSLSSLSSAAEPSSEDDDGRKRESPSDLLQQFMEEEYELLLLFEQARAYIAKHDRLKQKVSVLESCIREERKKYAELADSKERLETHLGKYIISQRETERLLRSTASDLEERVDALVQECDEERRRGDRFEKLYLVYTHKLAEVDQASEEGVGDADDNDDENKLPAVSVGRTDGMALAKDPDGEGYSPTMRAPRRQDSSRMSLTLRDSEHPGAHDSDTSVVEIIVDENDTVPDVVNKCNEHMKIYQQFLQEMHDDAESQRHKLDCWINNYKAATKKAAKNEQLYRKELNRVWRRDREHERYIDALIKVIHRLTAENAVATELKADEQDLLADNKTYADRITGKSNFSSVHQDGSEITLAETLPSPLMKRKHRRLSKTLFRLQRQLSEACEAPVTALTSSRQ